eukprot:06750_4
MQTFSWKCLEDYRVGGPDVHQAPPSSPGLSLLSLTSLYNWRRNSAGTVSRRHSDQQMGSPRPLVRIAVHPSRPNRDLRS